MQPQNLSCPCSSTKPLESCCAPYLSNQAIPATPSQLMRSRYTAYATCDINYIANTMLTPANDGFNIDSTKKWAKRIQWLRLEIIAEKMEGAIGFVEFKAYFQDGKKSGCLHELSEFHQVDGKWYYVNGQHFS